MYADTLYPQHMLWVKVLQIPQGAEFCDRVQRTVMTEDRPAQPDATPLYFRSIYIPV